MQKRSFLGEEISLLGMGCMRLPRLDPEKPAIDWARAKELIDRAYLGGVNYFDTAYMYHDGESERFVGEALSAYPRESFHVATKMPVWMAKSREDVETIFQNQLKNLRVSYFDFYLVHNISHEHKPMFDKYGVYDFLLEKKREGLIRHLGFSCHDTPEYIDAFCEAHPAFEFAQIQLNYLDWTMQRAGESYEVLRRRGMPVIVMEPVRGGLLARPCEAAQEILKRAAPDRSMASWAVRYAASLDGVMTVLSGMSTEEQVQDNLTTLSDFTPLSAAEREALARATEAFNVSRLIPCTSCRYCMDCPKGVDIPGAFSRYNLYAMYGDAKAYKESLAKLDEAARETHCVACGRCKRNCPQGIDIPAMLQKIHEIAESL